MVRIFGELKKKGWRPLRTIEFASWDGEEYNLIGSTEHVEARMDEIRRNGRLLFAVVPPELVEGIPPPPMTSKAAISVPPSD